MSQTGTIASEFPAATSALSGAAPEIGNAGHTISQEADRSVAAAALAAARLAVEHMPPSAEKEALMRKLSGLGNASAAVIEQIAAEVTLSAAAEPAATATEIDLQHAEVMNEHHAAKPAHFFAPPKRTPHVELAAIDCAPVGHGHGKDMEHAAEATVAGIMKSGAAIGNQIAKAEAIRDEGFTNLAKGNIAAARDDAHKLGLGTQNALEKWGMDKNTAQAAGHVVTNVGNVGATAASKGHAAADLVSKAADAVAHHDASGISKVATVALNAAKRNLEGIADGIAALAGQSKLANALSPSMKDNNLAGALAEYANVKTKSGARLFDHDGDGKVNLNELSTVLRNNGYDANNAELLNSPEKLRAALDKITHKMGGQTPAEIKAAAASANQQQAFMKEEPALEADLKKDHLRGHIDEKTHEFVSVDGKKHLKLTGDAAKDLIAIQAALHGSKVSVASNDSHPHAAPTTPNVAVKAAGQISHG